MKAPIVQFVDWRRPAIDYVEMPRIKRWKLPAEETPNRYLGTIKYAWEHQGPSTGLVVLEQDIAIEPVHLSQLDDLILLYPSHVAVAPYVLWPKSTGREEPVWSCGDIGSFGLRVYHHARIAPPARPKWFSLGCTYLPARLLEAAPDVDGNWDYPVLDTRLSELAARLGYPCRTTQAPAVHLHW